MDSELREALQSYTTVKDGYTQLLRSAAYKTGDERLRALNALENQNIRLQHAVKTLLKIWESGHSKLEQYSEFTIEGLREDLERYKKELSELQTGQDELSKLKTVYGSTQTDLQAQRYTYFAYIIAVLVLLIIDFVLFVVLSFPSYSAPTDSGMLESIGLTSAD
jgi:hypothetical protein